MGMAAARAGTHATCSGARVSGRCRDVQVQTLMHDAGSGRAPPRHAAAALWAILRDAGPLGLFKGYWATNCVWLPWNILYIALYEGCRRSARSALGRGESAPLPAAATMGCALAAASAATVATHPPDVIKTRLQVRGRVSLAKGACSTVAGAAPWWQRRRCGCCVCMGGYWKGG